MCGKSCTYYSCCLYYVFQPLQIYTLGSYMAEPLKAGHQFNQLYLKIFTKHDILIGCGESVIKTDAQILKRNPFRINCHLFFYTRKAYGLLPLSLCATLLSSTDISIIICAVCIAFYDDTMVQYNTSNKAI